MLNLDPQLSEKERRAYIRSAKVIIHPRQSNHPKSFFKSPDKMDEDETAW
jgi:hypothetical protein